MLAASAASIKTRFPHSAYPSTSAFYKRDVDKGKRDRAVPQASLILQRAFYAEPLPWLREQRHRMHKYLPTRCNTRWRTKRIEEHKRRTGRTKGDLHPDTSCM